MAIPRTSLIVIIAAFALVAGLAIAMSVIRMGPGNTVSGESQGLLGERLVSGERVSLVFPPRTIYRPGDAFSARLGIINMLDSDMGFYINIVQESGPNNGPVLNYARETSAIAPGESRILDISVATKGQTPKGIYSYMILVCDSQPCTAESPGLYSSAHMSFRII